MPEERLWNETEVAEYLGVRPKTLEKWRSLKRGPRFVKLGQGKGGRIRYNPEEVRAFVERQTYESTTGVLADGAEG